MLNLHGEYYAKNEIKEVFIFYNELLRRRLARLIRLLLLILVKLVDVVFLVSLVKSSTLLCLLACVIKSTLFDLSATSICNQASKSVVVTCSLMVHTCKICLSHLINEFRLD